MDKLSSENKFAIMPEWVIELDISHTAFRLYAVLARYADNVTHQAFPSLETLANRLGCGEKTVRRAIEDLVEHGAIKKHSRGRYQSSLYTVMTTPPKGTKMSGEGSKMSHEGSNMSTRLDKNVQVTRTTQLEPKNVEPLNSEHQPFDEWWSYFPRKEGKGAARKEFDKALKKVDLDVLVEAAENYRNDPNREPKFTVQPARWLREERWDDGPLPLNRSLTNSERNIENFRAKLALLKEPMKEVESNEPVRSNSIIDLGVNIRSAEDI
jgi:biotin operon repressor